MSRWNRNFATLLLTLLLGFGLSGCSDSDNDDGGPVDTNNNTVAEGVTGPLDPVQEPLSEEVFAQLAAATAGTPLEGLLDCAGQAVVIDLLDVVDAIAVALLEATGGGDPTQVLSLASENIQFSLQELANDLPGALTALAGSDCNGGSEGGFGGGDNPLAGTPLEALGDALAPVFGGLPASDSGEDLDLQALSALVHELAVAFQGALDMVPAEVSEAPIFGGLLTTLDTAFTDLDTTLTHLGVYDGEATAAALETTLDNLLVNVLTEIVPLRFIESEFAQAGQFTGPIEEGIALATQSLGDNLLDLLLPQVADALNEPLAILLDPIENQVLPAILGPITDALANSNNGNSSGGPTGTPLDLLIGPITDALNGSGTGPTGTPLDLILGPIFDALPTG